MRRMTRGASDAPIEPQRACRHSSLPWSIAALPIRLGHVEDLLGALPLLFGHVLDRPDADELEQRRLVASRLVDQPVQLVGRLVADLGRRSARRAPVVIDSGGEADCRAQAVSLQVGADRPQGLNPRHAGVAWIDLALKLDA